jgi:hypothetical protein
MSGVNSVRRRGLKGNFFSFSPRRRHFCTKLAPTEPQAGTHGGNHTYYKLYIGQLSPVMRNSLPKEEITYQKELIKSKIIFKEIKKSHTDLSTNYHNLNYFDVSNLSEANKLLISRWS